LKARQPVMVVAVAGGSGSGKTWFARLLQKRLHPEAGVLSLDDFYKDLSALPPARRDEVNFDCPSALDWPLFVQCLEEVLRGKPAALPRYRFRSHTRGPTPRRWRPRRIVVVEGLWPWWDRRVAGRYALKVYLNSPAGLRFSRRSLRDVRQRGRSMRSVLRQWREQSEPMFERYVQPQARTADMIVSAGEGREAVRKIAAMVHALATGKRARHDALCHATREGTPDRGGTAARGRAAGRRGPPQRPRPRGAANRIGRRPQ
jgi:uridine kinase